MAKFNQGFLLYGLSFGLSILPCMGAADTPAEQKCSGKECDVQCVEPHPACTESAKVIDILTVMAKAYTRGDMSTVSQYLSDGITTFDEGSKKLISGKEAVLEDIKKRYTNPEAPVLSYTIDHPYAQVHGNTAVVTFTAIKEVGGKHPSRFQNKATDIFVKEGDTWKKLHYRGNWKKIS